MELFFCGFNGFQQIYCSHNVQESCSVDVRTPVSSTEDDELQTAVMNKKIRDVQFSWDKMLILFDDNTGVMRGSSKYRIDNILCGSFKWKEFYKITKEGLCIGSINNAELEVDICDPPSETPSLTNKLCSVSAGDRHVIVVTEEGQAVALEQQSRSVYIPIPRALCLNVHIKLVSCGQEHVMMLSRIGVVFTYGIGGQGQLGHGNVENQQEPRVVSALEGVTITTLSAGGWHSTALSDIGDIYVWGWNERGQLGLPSRVVQEQQKKIRNSPTVQHEEKPAKKLKSCLERTDKVHQSGDKMQGTSDTTSDDVSQSSNEDVELINIMLYPRVLDLVSSTGDFINIVQVACGSRHTAALSDSGEVYTWGWNDYGQLGHGDRIARDTPTKVEQLCGKRVEQIWCGAWNTAWCCVDDNDNN